MVISLKDIRISGKQEADFSFDFSTDNLCDIPSVALISPIKVEGKVTLTGTRSALIEADIHCFLEGECTRCLNTTKKEYKTLNAVHSERKDIIKYVRKGNQIVCTITNEMGVFQGVAIQHPEDKFNYELGMTLATIRANKDMYNKLELDLLKLM